MITVPDNKVATAYRLFCKELELVPENWNSIFEFSAALGFTTIGGSIGFDANANISNRTARAIEWLNGPHSETIVKIFKGKRRSLRGRLSTPFIKVAHGIGFGLVSAWMVFRMLTGQHG